MTLALIHRSVVVWSQRHTNCGDSATPAVSGLWSVKTSTRALFTIPMSQRWPDELPVYDHLGCWLETASIERAEKLFATGDYGVTASQKWIKSLNHKGPPDGRGVADERALKAKGSRKAHYRQGLPSGYQCWSLKHQQRPWGVAI